MPGEKIVGRGSKHDAAVLVACKALSGEVPSGTELLGEVGREKCFEDVVMVVQGHPKEVIGLLNGLQTLGTCLAML